MTGRVLVTNDDGIASVGLHALAAALVEAGHDVVVVAPRDDMSGAGAAIGRFHADAPIVTERVEVEALLGVPAYAIDGPPALAVLAARLGGFGEPPALVISGINPGPNTGRATLHSGTVGAALTGANFGVSALAVSVEVSDPMRWDTAAQLAVRTVGWLEAAPRRTVVNLNVPAVGLAELRGVRGATLAPFGTVRAAVVRPAIEGGELTLELRATDEPLPPECDTAVVQRGFAAVTLLTGVRGEAAPSGLLARLEADRPAEDGAA